MVPNINETFEKMITLNTKTFADVAAKNINSMLEVSSRAKPVSFSNDGVVTGSNVCVSIMFTGMVYGEYILALDINLAAKMIGKSFDNLTPEQSQDLKSEIGEYFREILNVTVGESILGLTQVYQKLTMTAPRVLFGEVKYPKLKTGKSAVVNKYGEVECFLYVDQMKLDIADSYKTALLSVVNANKDLRSALEQLKQHQEKLVETEKLAALGTMAAGVAHEINTPLSVISLNESIMKEMVAENKIERDQFSKMLSKIEETVTKISKITQALRAYAVDTSGNADPEFSKASVNSIIDSALLFCESHLQQQGIQITPFRLPETVQIECRPQQLSQALYNVILNASEAIEGLPEKWIRIDAYDKDDKVAISITDSGAGVPMEHRDKIFDPFYTTKEVGKGKGLGLSLAKGIVDLHQGKISIDPKSKNTKFLIEVPKRKAAKESKAA